MIQFLKEGDDLSVLTGSVVAGVDVGSLSTEVVLMNQEGDYQYIVLPTGANSKTAAKKAMDQALQQIGYELEQLSFVLATGYGRISIPFADKRVTEITCHGKGAHYLYPSASTVIDIGGQDSKVIRLSPQGKVLDFVMNEKCAAGTGRFLEVMTRTLEVELADMEKLSRKAREAVPISSMCTVFAESEVVSLIAEGHPVEEIIRGIHDSIADRTVGMVNRVGLEKDLVMTGGVAKNGGVVECLQERLGIAINLPEEPQIVGALGAALLASREAFS